MEGRKMKSKKALVKIYHDFLLDQVAELKKEGRDLTEKNLLNGARTWHDYSLGGLAYVYHHELIDLFYEEDNFNRLSKKGQDFFINNDLYYQAYYLRLAAAQLIEEGVIVK